VILHAVFIFPISTIANIYRGYPHITGKDSGKLVIGVDKIPAVIRYAAGGGFLGGNGFAELGAVALFQGISPPFSTGVEKVVEMTRSCIKKEVRACGRGAPASPNPKPLKNHVISTKVFE
jgi:hypothetical protein